MYQKEDASCKKCKNLLFDFVSDYTKESQNQWLKEHLTHCPSCQKEYEEIQRMLSLLHEEPRAELPAGFQLSLHRKLVDAAQEMEGKKEKSWIHKLKAMPVMRTVAPALVCLVLVMGVFSSGLFEDWKNADSILVEEPKQLAVNTQPPAETSIPTAEKTVEPNTATPKQTVSKPAKDKALSKQEPAKTEELPVVASSQEESAAVESVQEETEIAVVAETTGNAAGGSRAFSIEKDATEPVATSYVLSIPQPVLSFLKEASRETSTDWTAKADCDGMTATLHLSESEWELLSNYIQSLNLVPTMLAQGDTGTEITVTIQGIEG